MRPIASLSPRSACLQLNSLKADKRIVARFPELERLQASREPLRRQRTRPDKNLEYCDNSQIAENVLVRVRFNASRPGAVAVHAVACPTGRPASLGARRAGD